jgi:hypothetical protein
MLSEKRRKQQSRAHNLWNKGAALPLKLGVGFQKLFTGIVATFKPFCGKIVDQV